MAIVDESFLLYLYQQSKAFRYELRSISYKSVLLQNNPELETTTDTEIARMCIIATTHYQSCGCTQKVRVLANCSVGHDPSSMSCKADNNKFFKMRKPHQSTNCLSCIHRMELEIMDRYEDLIRAAIDEGVASRWTQGELLRFKETYLRTMRQELMALRDPII